MFAQVTQRLFPLCGQSSTRIVQSSSSRVMRPALSFSASSTILSENTCMRDNFHHGRTIIPSIPFSTWRYYSPINCITTTTMPISSISRTSRFVTSMGDINDNNHAQQQTTRGFATKKVSFSCTTHHPQATSNFTPNDVLCNDNFFYILVSLSLPIHTDHSPISSQLSTTSFNKAQTRH